MIHKNMDVDRNYTSRFKGLSWCSDKKRWRVRIRIDGITNTIGYFVDEIEAAKAYNEAAMEYHGDFTDKVNII